MKKLRLDVDALQVESFDPATTEEKITQPNPPSSTR